MFKKIIPTLAIITLSLNNQEIKTVQAIPNIVSGLSDCFEFLGFTPDQKTVT